MAWAYVAVEEAVKDTLTQSNYYTILHVCGSWARNPGLAHTVPENRDERAVYVCFDKCPELPP